MTAPSHARLRPLTDSDLALVGRHRMRRFGEGFHHIVRAAGERIEGPDFPEKARNLGRAVHPFVGNNRQSPGRMYAHFWKAASASSRRYRRSVPPRSRIEAIKDSYWSGLVTTTT